MMFLEDNQSNTTNVKLKQFKLEYEAWMRTLNYFQLENIYLKNRLGQLVKLSENHNFIVELDAFQNSFVEKDTFISLLKRDISEQNLMITQAGNATGDNIENIVMCQKKLRGDIQNMEREYNKLKFNFNNFVANELT